MRLKERILAWKWLIPLSRLVKQGEIDLPSAFSFIFARLTFFRVDFVLNGIKFHAPDRDIWAIARNIFIYREYNPPNYTLHKGDVVADIGAHRGVFSGFAAKLTGAPVLAFEPDQQNYQAMDRLIQLNGLTQVQAYNVAVSGVNGPIHLYKSKATTRHSTTGRDLMTGEALVDFNSIPSISLDDALITYPRIDFLKMDCEGAEYEIIRHASSQTLHKISKMAMEYHGMIGDEQLAKLVDRLENEGFTVTIKPDSKINKLGMLFARRV